MESLESLDNYRNSQFEEHYEEIGDNAANEKLLSYIYNEVNNSYNQYHNKINDDNCISTTIKATSSSSSSSSMLLNEQKIIGEQNQNEEEEEEDIFVPVRFARTEVGTYFWTTNLQPAAIITTVTTPLGDNMDLIQPALCYTNCQYPQLQFQDRWAQA
ncbi:enhancer of split malpha protein [Condylostylus longicornis]|uniref:enhancer of split malpha protein n=1 Tax=Condylostylus longicornis TaxID=2530218 RepID=UPI00244DB79A|nr:enhancer of split malpha protein [Condylostylus longicornis]